ncbi:CD209 antigen-like protein C isoform X1 [Onychostoma macrolepis]|nr:CD209 antigen-like protein C isoform X1 [Onychostoma macrolepis]
MNREHRKSINDIYENAFVTEGKFGERTTDSHTKKIQSSELTGSDGVKSRSSRAVVVCLPLLCVLLTAAKVLCVLIHSKSTDYTQERQQLLTKITNLTEERDQLLTNNMNLTEERDQLKSEKSELQKFSAGVCQFFSLNGGWKCHQSSLYFISSEKKSWTESRRYCTDRRADLIIINNREEQDFVKDISGGDLVWIGLTDSHVEGRWKWVDGSDVTSGFWEDGQPNSFQGKEEDCALIHSPGWADYPCDYSSKWICEKSIFK